MSYMESPSGTPAVQSSIRSTLATAAGGSNILGSLLTNIDAYRAFLGTGDYTWGSNSTKAAKGELFAALRPCLTTDAADTSSAELAEKTGLDAAALQRSVQRSIGFNVRIQPVILRRQKSV